MSTGLKRVAGFAKKNHVDIEQIGPFYFVKGTLSHVQKRHLEHLLNLHGDEYIAGVLDDLHKVVNLHTLSSLRMIDWLVTNFSKSRPVIHKGNDVHALYVRWRHNYNRVLFDPFRRRTPVYYLADSKCECGGKCGGMGARKSSQQFTLTISHRSVVCTTTVAQINFFMFAREADLLGYIKDHSATVEQHQAKCIRAAKEKREKLKGKFKRTKLSKAYRPTCIASRLEKIF